MAASLQQERDAARGLLAKREQENQSLSAKVVDLANQLSNATSQIKGLKANMKAGSSPDQGTAATGKGKAGITPEREAAAKGKGRAGSESPKEETSDNTKALQEGQKTSESPEKVLLRIWVATLCIHQHMKKN